LEADKNLAKVKHKSPKWTYDPEFELDAYKFLGAYIGALTGLQLAILKGNERIALDIIDSSLGEGDLDEQFGGGNSALHLATFFGMKEVVRRLLDRGADRNLKVFAVLYV
jgi:ankyrin repeat protein